MTLTVLPAVLAIMLGGACIGLQAPINGALGRMLGDPLAAAAVSFGVGFAALAGAALLRTGPPAAGMLSALPWWAWAGGLLGAVYVSTTVWAVPQIGVVTGVAAIVLGQMTAAMALDAVGAFGVPAEPITAKRVLAAALVLTGVVLSRS
jgi:transporter family-2 protein